jgi:hypothetical protein
MTFRPISEIKQEIENLSKNTKNFSSKEIARAVELLRENKLEWNFEYDSLIIMLQQAQEFIRIINEWHSEYGYGVVDKIDVEELKQKVQGEKR